jgi:hypothetical protein
MAAIFDILNDPNRFTQEVMEIVIAELFNRHWKPLTDEKEAMIHTAVNDSRNMYVCPGLDKCVFYQHPGNEVYGYCHTHQPRKPVDVANSVIHAIGVAYGEYDDADY